MSPEIRPQHSPFHHANQYQAQPPTLWRPQQFYTGKVGAPPPDAPATTASEWNKEAPNSGHIETLFAEKAAKTSHAEEPTTVPNPQIAEPIPQITEPIPQTTEPSPAAEVKIQLPANPEASSNAIPSNTLHTVISVTTKPDNNNNGESKQTHVVTLEVPASEMLTKVPVVEDITAQIAQAA